MIFTNKIDFVLLLKKKMLHCTFLTAQAARSIVNLSMLAHCICKGVFAPIRRALLNF